MEVGEFMRDKKLSLLVAIQSIINGLWLLIHNGKVNYTREIRGFEHMEILNSAFFSLLVIVTGIFLIYSIVKKSNKIHRWSLVAMNAIWSAYTVILLINEFNGVPNMSWALFLGYNAAIYLAARYEVID